MGKIESAADALALFGLVGLLLLLFLLLVLLLLFLAVLPLLLLPGGSLLCGLQGFFQVAGRLVGLALRIDRHLHLVLDGGLDTPLFERRLVVLWEHEIGLLAGLPRDIAVVLLALLVHQAGHLDRAPGFEFEP